MAINKPKILIVDDNESVRVALALYLEKENYCVITASSAGEAISIIKKENPQILILDKNMPGMSGIELLKEIRKFNSRIKALMMSGDKLDNETKTELEKLNVSDYIVKLDLSDLTRDLKKLL